MAGLAFGMLIPGMVLGAALLYFMRTKRLVQEEKLRMGFMGASSSRTGRHDDLDQLHDPDDADDAPPHQIAYDTPN